MKSVTFTKKSGGLTAILVDGRVVMVRSKKGTKVTVQDTARIPKSRIGVRAKVEKLKKATPKDLGVETAPPAPKVEAPPPVEEKKEEPTVKASVDEELSSLEQNIESEGNEASEDEVKPKKKRGYSRKKKSTKEEDEEEGL